MCIRDSSCASSTSILSSDLFSTISAPGTSSDPTISAIQVTDEMKRRCASIMCFGGCFTIVWGTSHACRVLIHLDLHIPLLDLFIGYDFSVVSPVFHKSATAQTLEIAVKLSYRLPRPGLPTKSVHFQHHNPPWSRHIHDMIAFLPTRPLRCVLRL